MPTGGLRAPLQREAGHGQRYRKRGLGGTSRDLVELAGDVSGETVLEVGGGVGAIELELLAAGADRATNVELSGEYEEEAATLLADRGLTERLSAASPTSSRCPSSRRTSSSCTASSVAIRMSTA